MCIWFVCRFRFDFRFQYTFRCEQESKVKEFISAYHITYIVTESLIHPSVQNHYYTQSTWQCVPLSCLINTIRTIKVIDKTSINTFGILYFPEIAFEERCVFTANESTVFLSIVRVFYTTPSGRGGAESRVELPPCRLTYRTFTPAQTVIGTSSSLPEYEDTRNLCDRVNQWMQITGKWKLFKIANVTIFGSNFYGLHTDSDC
jgi:hypothetical protein